MPLEFRCEQCGRMLRTPDEAAGKQAQCPQCGGLTPVPCSTPPAMPLGGLTPSISMPQPWGELPAVRPPDAAKAYGSSAAGENPYQPPTLLPERLSSYAAGDPRAAAASVSGPALALIFCAVLGLVASTLISLFLLASWSVNPPPPDPNVPPWAVPAVLTVMFFVVPAGLSTLVLIGAIKMRRLENYAFAMVASILAMIPCNCFFVLTIPLGIWALVVLSDPAVREAFRS